MKSSQSTERQKGDIVMLKNKSLKRIAVSNTVFIVIQVLAIAVGLFTAKRNGFTIFLLFAPTVLFVLYNIVVQSLLDFGYFYKKYNNEIDYTFGGLFAEIRIIKRAKAKNDKLGLTLICQKYASVFLAVINIIIQLILIFIYHPEMIG